MNKKQPIIIILLLLALGRSAGQSLQENDFTRYSTAEGLSDNDVTGVTQDKKGYLWIATSSGLNRFDGTRFRQYHSTDDTLSPASENFYGLKWIDRDRLAFYTMGLHIINTKTGERRNLFIPWHDKYYQFKFNALPEVHGDEEGNIFVLNRSGFYQFDKNYRLVFRFDYYKENEVPAAYFIFGRELLSMDPDRLLIVAVDGFYIYRKKEKKLHKLSPGEEPLLNGMGDTRDEYIRMFQTSPGCMIQIRQNSDSIYYLDFIRRKRTVSPSPVLFSKEELAWRCRLLPGPDSVFYLTGFYSGFYRLHLNRQTGHIILDNGKYFKSLLCYGLLNDREGRLWVATNNGLYRQQDTRSKIEIAWLPPELEIKFPNTRINTVAVSGNNVYAGSRTRAGLLVFDKKDFRFKKQVFFSEPSPLPGKNNIYRIIPVGPNELFLGANSYLLRYNETTEQGTMLKPEGWKEDWVNDFFTDSRHQLWISAYNLYRYHFTSRQFSMIPLSKPIPSVPVAIREDREGNIWVAGQGISRYNTATRSFDYRIDSFPYISFPDKRTTAMEIDKQDNIWFGATNNGLIRYNIGSKTFRHFTRSDGLPDNNISSLLLVGNQLWVACYSGLACLDLSSEEIKSFGKEEGFPDMPIMAGGTLYYDSLEKLVYAGFFNALVRFNPDELLRPAIQPSLFIENLDIGSRNIFRPESAVRSAWKQNDLRVTIGSINFTDGKNQGFAYRLFRDEASPWQPLGNEPAFSISNLAPGKHRVQVKLFSLRNRWPEQQTEIIVEIRPPFWQQTWFRILMVLLVLSGIFLLVQWSTDRARKKEMEKTLVEKWKADDYKNKYELEQISHYFSTTLAGKKTPGEVLWDVAQNLIGRMNYEDCILYGWNKDKTKMIQVAAFGPKGKPELLHEQLFEVEPGQGVVGYVMQTKEPVLIGDTRTDSRYRVDDASRLSEICVPIIHDGDLLGVIDSEHSQPDYFSERDVKILTTIATLVGNKLKQLESEQSLEVKEKELSHINEQLAEAKLSALQAQMNPHFVFNALNSIKRMILDGENEKASRYLSKFALLIRMTLNHSREAFVTLSENLEYLRTYLGMEQLRFNGTFSWKLSVADDIDPEETLIPSLMIQPLVENAIWHGLLPSEKDKELSVDFSRQDKTITCLIEDNGIGIRQSQREKEQHNQQHRSVGLDNIRNRIHILNEKFGAACRLSITDRSDLAAGENGTQVKLQFTLNSN